MAKGVQSVADWIQSVTEGVQSVTNWIQSVTKGVQSVTDWIQSIAKGVQSVMDWIHSVTNWVHSVTDWVQFAADWVASRTAKNRFSWGFCTFRAIWAGRVTPCAPSVANRRVRRAENCPPCQFCPIVCNMHNS